ncbi:MarR family winged helix-turn-helix transcriptional regulator [Marisediminicola senii]|uniref:MarR family winged helix-turn-helix transcriptional regulator n=1 Tax=Marisediminicola senii TaxID=2711233 RepID=UPI0013EA35DF|nr:winged helix DNA-binding protein [Marisediminicola senii]
MNDETDSRLHYRSDLVQNMTSLLNIWHSPRFQRDIVTERHRSLSTLEVRLVWTLGSLGPSRPSELSAALDVTATSLSKAIAKLDAAGIVTREPSPHDRRSHTLHLSAEGRRAAQELYDVGDAMVTEIFADWNERDVLQLSALIARFVAESDAYARRIHREDPA